MLLLFVNSRGIQLTELQLDESVGGVGARYVPRNFPPVLADANWCGASFNRGLLRIHDSVSGPEAAESVALAFAGEVSSSVDVVAFDWAGRQFVVDEGAGGVEGQAHAIYGADPATGLIEEVADIDEFLLLLQVPEVTAVLQSQRFEQALIYHGRDSLRFDEVVAVRKPMFFGGEDVPTNTEIQDVSVYWGLNAQLIREGKDGGAFRGFRASE
ncbi:hypothetical protein [Curtobacterium flaccumfaciens]|uniref:hypothetical protein n=1 Tax=Curtobacterium flaccumfaciens TaxID=2035 RepID=UPI000FFF0CCD|nr:hypothetical protein [Curtobacterium flaccumfaciens]MCS0645010.1 DUF1851 domain-containing protein [Curtobacterium flaccumfaciens pv. flaccumfaciens]MCS6526702.1 DUF1851 domain-containing protein [Curtobacterium flaccumfaciens pv. flaccumfaciens]MCS6530459.1 DUF1851 domain-containing protein [Curtobacterium flaccumfaciens pv. flaccumfaciens]NUU12156.1 hypothetical protein [Curtobacterium flaccumfaciens]